MQYLKFNAPLLTADDEIVLSKQVEVGVLAQAALEGRINICASTSELLELVRLGQESYHRLVTSNLRLVALVVFPNHSSSVGQDELFQEGSLGLLEAVRRFDHRRGFRFATFALPWIRMRVSEVIATQAGRVGLPARRAKVWRQAHARRLELAEKLGRTPTAAELAAAWGRPTDWVEELLAWRLPASLPDEVAVGFDDAEPTEYDVKKLLAPVSGELRRVMMLRFGLEDGKAMTVAEVAAELGISESTVRRRERRAVEVLRAELDLDQIAA